MPCPGSKCELHFICSAVYENNEPPCSSDHKESLPTDKQQLKAEILPIMLEAIESFDLGECGDGERLFRKATAKLSAI